jgi:hypothetical protein
MDATKLLFGEGLADAEHLVECHPQTLQHRLPVQYPELLGADVHMRRHIDQRHGRGRIAVAAGRVEADEVATKKLTA